ncbi:PIN domain-containing protein [Candidatus Woesearchaeota archaeon]|nr:PIN domain-containing protein [Candidatus Woesearchaeota archaeon]
MSEYFFDSYALIEIIKGNPKYFKYSEKAVIITWLNLVEVAYSTFLDHGEEKAKKIYNIFKDCVENFDWTITLNALKLKQKYKKRNLSYADCLGYAFAKERGLIFLTGDGGFEDLENVEFVKS